MEAGISHICSIAFLVVTETSELTSLFHVSVFKALAYTTLMFLMFSSHDNIRGISTSLIRNFLTYHL